MKYKRFEDLTPKELKKIVNGCGGKGSKIKPPYATMNKANCDHHDYGYWKGGNWKDRLKCDWEFYKALLKDSMVWKNPLKKVWFSGWSTLYFAGVRFAGWKFFNYKEKGSYDLNHIC